MRVNPEKRDGKESPNDIVAAEEMIPTRKPWITREMTEEMKELRKWKHQSTEKARQKYRRLKNTLQRTTQEEIEKWWE